MSAALVGFLFLVIICAFGIWTINGGISGIKERFLTKDSATKRCDEELKICNENVAKCVPNKPCGYSSAKCKESKEACDAIVASAFTKAADKKVVTDYKDLAASAVDSRIPPSELELLLRQVKANALRTTPISSLWENAGIMGDSNTLAASAEEKQKNSAEVERLLKQINERSIGKKLTSDEIKKLANTGTVPVDGVSSGRATYASYMPIPKIIRAHQTPEESLPTMTASAQTDKGSQVEKILTDEKKLASIREMIRDETASAVRDELSKSRLFNQYEINYESI